MVCLPKETEGYRETWQKTGGWPGYTKQFINRQLGHMPKDMHFPASHLFPPVVLFHSQFSWPFLAISPSPPPEGTLCYCTCAQAAGSTKRRKNIGSSVAYKTRGTFSVTRVRHEDACGQSTGQTKAEAMQRNAVTTAKRQLPDLTAVHTLNSLRSGNAAPPPPPGLSLAFAKDVPMV